MSLNRKFDRRAVRTLAAAVSTVGLAALAPVAVAQDASGSDEVKRLITPSSEVTVGVNSVSSKTAPNTAVGNWQSSTNYKFGDYNGLYKASGTFIGDVSINKRGEGNANYLEINGTNLGLDSRNLVIRGGEQGNFGLSLEYDQIHKLWSDSYQTPYLNAGSTKLTLPDNWVPGATTATMTRLSSSMNSLNIETERKSIIFGVTKLLPDDWDVAASYKHETKEGNRLIGAVFGTSGGNPRAAVLPEPVDYVTRHFDLIARYSTDKLQAQVAYYGSLFDNKNRSLMWRNAYTNAAWPGLPVGYGDNGFGQIGLPPDNQAHQINGSLSYQLTKDTRLAGNLSFGRMTQNEQFLPYTVNAGLVSTGALPRSSLNGKVNTAHFDLKLTSKLNSKMNLVAAYRFDDRANKTPQSLYNYIGGDAASQTNIGSTNANSDRLRYNLPGSSTKQQIDVELDYKLAAHTKLKVGAGYDWVTKTFEAITKEKEATLKGEVHHHFNESTNGGLSYAYSDRNTDDYNAYRTFAQAFTPLYVAGMGAPSLQWDNNPYQKKFFMAPRLRDKIRGFMNFEPAPKMDVQVAVDYKDDNYKDSYYGLKRVKTLGEHFSANYAASDAFTARMFFSFDRSTSDEKSNTLAAACGGGKALPTAPGCEWAANIIDRGITGGFGFTYKPSPKYSLGFDYSRSMWTGENNMSAGAGLLQPTPLPADASNLHRMDLFASYQIEKDLTLNVKYIYERLRSNDWAVDGVVSNTLANVIGTNQTSPNYNAHALGVSVSYQFQ